MNNETNMCNPIRGNSRIFLRPPDLSDLEVLVKWENDLSFKVFTSYKQQYSKSEIELFIKNNEDIRANLQYRLMICKQKDKNVIGTIDLYEIDFAKGSAGVGILIANETDRKKGFALTSLKLIEQFSKDQLGLKRLTSEINKENQPSLNLFKKAGFKRENKVNIAPIIETITNDVYFYEKIL